MSLAPSTTLSLAFTLQPTGWALPADPASNWGGMLAPLANLWSAAAASMESMLPQVDPRQATTLLPAWEAALGPDPCGRDLLAATLLERQTLAYQRLTARGGSSIPYWLQQVTAVGDTATIVEGAWCKCGAAVCGASRLSAPGNEFNWMLLYAAAIVTPSQCGEAQCGRDRCGGLFTQSLSQCPITHGAPAHTNVTFNYTGSWTP